MTAIAWPTGAWPHSFSMRLATVQRVHSSPFGGSEQVVDLLNDRWMASLELPGDTNADIAAVEAFIAALRGQTNTVALYHFGRVAPQGTMRGTPALNAAHAQGAATLNAGTSTAGETLKMGDMIGVGGLLLMVAADCVSDGAGLITVPLANRLRTALSSGAPITWDKPTANFRLVSPSAVQYIASFSEPVSLDFVEAIA